VIPQVPVQPGTIEFPRDAGANSLDSSLERDTSAILVEDSRRAHVDAKPSNKFIEVNELEFNRRRGDQEEWRLGLLKQIQDKELRAREEKRKKGEEEYLLELKLQRERQEIAARERAEILDKQKKIDDLKKANELIHQDTIVRTKAKEFRTPQVTTNKAMYIGEDGYDELEKMLVRNAHNELRNDFNLSIERMKQEFSMTNK